MARLSRLGKPTQRSINGVRRGGTWLRQGLRKEAATEAALGRCRDVACPAKEDGTVHRSHGLKAERNAVNGRYVGVAALRQAGHTPFAAFRAPQFFVPVIIDHIEHTKYNKSVSPICRSGSGPTLRQTEPSGRSSQLSHEPACCRMRSCSRSRSSGEPRQLPEPCRAGARPGSRDLWPLRPAFGTGLHHQACRPR